MPLLEVKDLTLGYDDENVIINYEAQINTEGNTYAGLLGSSYMYDFFSIIGDKVRIEKQILDAIRAMYEKMMLVQLGQCEMEDYKEAYDKYVAEVF